MSWKPDYAWQKQAHAEIRDRWPEGSELPRCHKDEPKKLAAMVGFEDWPQDGSKRWHISVQHRERVPNWEELVYTAHSLRPGVCFVVGIPPRSWWLNAHPRVLHLVQTLDEGLIEEWRQNAKGHTPT